MLQEHFSTTAMIKLPGNAVVEKRSEEHTSELQSHLNLVCRLLLEKKKNMKRTTNYRHQDVVQRGIRSHTYVYPSWYVPAGLLTAVDTLFRISYTSHHSISSSTKLL